MAAHFVVVTADDASVDQVKQALRQSGFEIAPLESEPLSVAVAVDDQVGLRNRVAALVNQASKSELARLEAAATVDASDDLDERFWGPAPDSAVAAKAVVADLSEQFAQRGRLAEDGLSREEVANLLGIAAQSVTSKLESGKLIGIKAGREWRLPRWQFEPDNVGGVLPDLAALQAAFPGGPVSLSNWVTRPHPEFDGRTPRDEMIARGSAPVIKVALALTAAGW